jgi:hypothetical protein
VTVRPEHALLDRLTRIVGDLGIRENVGDDVGYVSQRSVAG